MAQSLDEKISELHLLGAQTVYAEKYPGTTIEQPEFQKVLSVLQPGDILIVAKMDRLVRTVKGSLEVMDQLQTKSISLRIGNIGTFETDRDGKLTPMAKMMRTMMLAFAEYERDMIVERTQTGRAYARTHVPNFKGGRKPVINGRHLNQMLEYYDIHTVKETVSAFNISKATLRRRVAERKAQQI